MKCPNCSGTQFNYTNWYDEQTQKIMRLCINCNHLFIATETLIDVTNRNDIGNILMGFDMEASLKRIEEKFKPLDKVKKELERGVICEI